MASHELHQNRQPLQGALPRCLVPLVRRGKRRKLQSAGSSEAERSRVSRPSQALPALRGTISKCVVRLTVVKRLLISEWMPQ